MVGLGRCESQPICRYPALDLCSQCRHIAKKLGITSEELRGYFEMPLKSYRD
jgi:hypothetical protein